MRSDITPRRWCPQEATPPSAFCASAGGTHRVLRMEPDGIVWRIAGVSAPAVDATAEEEGEFDEEEGEYDQ